MIGPFLRVSQLYPGCMGMTGNLLFGPRSLGWSQVSHLQSAVFRTCRAYRGCLFHLCPFSGSSSPASHSPASVFKPHPHTITSTLPYSYTLVLVQSHRHAGVCWTALNLPALSLSFCFCFCFVYARDLLNDTSNPE